MKTPDKRTKRAASNKSKARKPPEIPELVDWLNQLGEKDLPAMSRWLIQILHFIKAGNAAALRTLARNLKGQIADLANLAAAIVDHGDTSLAYKRVERGLDFIFHVTSWHREAFERYLLTLKVVTGLASLPDAPEQREDIQISTDKENRLYQVQIQIPSGGDERELEILLYTRDKTLRGSIDLTPNHSDDGTGFMLDIFNPDGSEAAHLHVDGFDKSVERKGIL